MPHIEVILVDDNDREVGFMGSPQNSEKIVR